MIKITNNCNFQCSICGNWLTSDRQYISKEDLENFFNKYYKDILFLTITGGEPFLDREHLVDLITFIKKKCPNLFYISINTNGYFTDKILITLYNLLQRFIFLKIYVGINYIPNKEWGFMRTGKEDAYLKVNRTIDKLNKVKQSYKRRLNIYKMFTINSKEDFKYLEVINEDIWINFSEVDNFYNNTRFKDVGNLAYKEKIQFLKSYYRKNKKSMSIINKRYVKYLIQVLRNDRNNLNCYAGINRRYIDSDGKEYICHKGVKKMEDVSKSSRCIACWTPCEATFDIVQYLNIIVL